MLVPGGTVIPDAFEIANIPISRSSLCPVGMVTEGAVMPVEL